MSYVPIDLRTDEQRDREEYAEMHMILFGHTPVPDLSGHRLCAHAMHDMAEAVLSMPGVHVEMDFDGHEQVTHDDVDEISEVERREAAVQVQRDMIREHEERKAFDRRKAESHDGRGKRLW